jgi:glycosyltransferase involved in cell wall biosynthesis
MQTFGKLSGLSVIVTCYNKIEFIDPVFDYLKRLAQLDAEIIMIDDGSNDGSTEKLLEKKSLAEFPFLLERIENRGLAGARDYGIEQSSKEVVFCLDIDDTPNIENLANFFVDFLRSETLIGQANFTFSETGELGAVTVPSDHPITFNTRDHRNEVFDSRSWWRFLYRRDFLMRPENRFSEVFRKMDGKSFVLDDIFWMLHLSAVDHEIFQSSSTTSIYNYYLPEHNGAQRWESYLRQITLLPEATLSYVHSLDGHLCKHDDNWLYRTMFKVLWDHSTLLGYKLFFRNSLKFFSAGHSVSRKLSFSYQLLNLAYLSAAPIRILKYQNFR